MPEPNKQVVSKIAAALSESEFVAKNEFLKKFTIA